VKVALFIILVVGLFVRVLHMRMLKNGYAGLCSIPDLYQERISAGIR